MHPYWGIQVANGQRNKDGNIIISKVAPNLHQTGEVQKKENPETIAVSGFLKFNMGDRLSLGELGCTTGGLQAVLLLLANPKTLVYQGFSGSLSLFNP